MCSLSDMSLSGQALWMTSISVNDKALWVTRLCEWHVSMSGKSPWLTSLCLESFSQNAQQASEYLFSDHGLCFFREGLCRIVTFIHMPTSFSMSYKEVGLLSAGISESMRQRTETLGDGGSRWGRQRQQAGGSEHERLVGHQHGDIWLKDLYSFCPW